MNYTDEKINEIIESHPVADVIAKKARRKKRDPWTQSDEADACEKFIYFDQRKEADE